MLFRGTPINQQGAIGRFSVSISGQVSADDQSNWGLTGTVTGEVDLQDYPYDPSRTGAASALTIIGASVQNGGNDYAIDFVGTQTIKVQEQ